MTPDIPAALAPDLQESINRFRTISQNLVTNTGLDRLMQAQAKNTQELERALEPLRQQSQAITARLASMLLPAETALAALPNIPAAEPFDMDVIDELQDLRYDAERVREEREIRVEEATIAMGEAMANLSKAQSATLRELRAQEERRIEREDCRARRDVRRSWLQLAAVAVTTAIITATVEVLIRAT